MKRTLSLLLFAFCSLLMTKAAFATNWYVRADGGTRYSNNATSGQCDGQSDKAYPGTGTNQHCAFNDYRSLWDDRATYGSYNPAWHGGDTIILDNTKQWRVGFDQGLSAGDQWCVGQSGPYYCHNPTVPAGTPQQHTRILGRNWASCSTGAGQPDPSKMTQIFGGYGLDMALNLTGAQYVDVECLEITRHSQCITHGYPAYPSSCNKYFPIDDFDSDGIVTDTATHDVLLQDLWIHGHTDRGIIGPIGGLVATNRVNIDTNGMAGWDLDRGDGTGSPNGILKMSYTTIQWSGCNPEYPAVDPIPVTSCYSQSTGGYGDGMGTPITPMVSVSIDHSIFRYNTQDGEDFGHVSNAQSLSITNSASYGNNGGQFKFAGFQNVTVENNLAVANCLRMSQPLAGAPSTYNQHLSDFCRAQDALSFDFNNNATALFANNTIISYAPTTFDIQCYDATSCAGTTLTMTNNVVMGYSNPTTFNMGGQVGGVGGFCGAGCNGSQLPLGTFNRSNNLFYGIRGACIANTVVDALHGSSTGESCLDPQFNNEPAHFNSEATLDGFDFSLSSSSPAKSGGTNVTGLIADYLGATRKNPPSMGALEFASAVSLNTLANWVSTAVSGSSSSSTGGATSTGTSTPPITTPAPPPPTPPVVPKGPYATKFALTATKGPSKANPAILTATVTAIATNTGAVGGTVIIYTSANWPVASGAVNANGTVSWTVPQGLTSQTLHGVYNGSMNYVKSTSNQVSGPATLAMFY